MSGRHRVSVCFDCGWLGFPFKDSCLPSLVPAQKTFDAEGVALQHASTKSLWIGNEAIKSLCSTVRRLLGRRQSRKNAKAIIRTLFRHCGKP